MEITGVICEFNPFHNGHKILLEKVKKDHPNTYIICLMSGHFVQRGEPAIIDRQLRVKAALLCGADLVAELPVYYTLQSAEGFAYGGVSILNELNCVDMLAFGSECGQIDELCNLALEINKNEATINEHMKTTLKSGMNYGKTLYSAIAQTCDNANLIESPNNLLGIEYILALKKLQSRIKPTTYKIQTSKTVRKASEIRSQMLSNKCLKDYTDFLPDITASLYDILKPYDYIQLNDFWNIICYLLRNNSSDLSNINGITEGYENKLVKAALDSNNYDEFIQNASLKRFTDSRLKRIICSILLGVKKADILDMSKSNYFRVLGYRKQSGELLSVICNKAKCPVIIKAKELKEVCKTNELLKKDVLASDLYYLAARQSGRKEYTNKLIVI